MMLNGVIAEFDEQRIDRSIEMAEQLIAAARMIDHGSGRGERRRQRRLSLLVEDRAAKDFTIGLTDEVLRIADAKRSACRLSTLVDAQSVSTFPAIDRVLLKMGKQVAPLAPRMIMPLVEGRLRAETRAVILPREDPQLARHLARRHGAGFATNLNVLGEAIVGDDEADRRLRAVLATLQRPDVSYVSVKISAVCAGVSALAFDDTVSRVVQRLRILYREAQRQRPHAFVNLDMEEYRDLAPTIAAFRASLDHDEFADLEAGIVLQAYLPDSHDAATELCEWALARRAAGGARVKVRLVKGANLAMERVDAELHGWPVATYSSKADVDASYKRLLDTVLDPRYDDAIRVGLASHNLFDVAWGLVLRGEMLRAGRPDRLEFEMLEGMAPAQADAVRDAATGVLLYTPVVARDDFAAAIAYLVRRLDENTSPENFLSCLFEIEPGGAVFEREAAAFTAAAHRRHDITTRPARTQDRRQPPARVPFGVPFRNEPDTDMALAANRQWIASAISAWQPRQPVAAAPASDVEQAVEVAVAAQQRWSSMEGAQRSEMVHRVGDVIAEHRGAVLATMAYEAGKTVTEGDPEVSEAVDFARYYATFGNNLANSEPLGTVVVVPPWNFPYAIPMGGVLAALAAGNTVILKPAPQTRASAALVAEHCWEAGVPREVLQLIPCDDDAAGRRLITHPDVDAVVLTGAHDTAMMFLDWKPDLRLHAETSGKNAMVITASADIDLAIHDLVRSAFGHAGQKCSAASLAIVDALLYDDHSFMERLRDAVATLRVGQAVDPATDVGPLIGAPSGALRRGLTLLEPGERWLVEPRQIGDDDRRWSPGVRLGVEPHSWFARTECFGPVLGVVRAADFDDALRIQNASPFGLTAGLHSLDPDEVARWSDAVEVGNAYVNRSTTGAIVRRQPFGGWKHSSVGPTAKAGGPHYVASLRRWHDDSQVPDAGVADVFARWARDHTGAGSDPSGLRSEQNVFRYRPLPGGVAFRMGPLATDRSLCIARAAASAASARLVTSSHENESDAEFADRLETLGVDRLRVAGGTTDVVRVAAHRARIPVDEQAPTAVPDAEMWRWVREQVLSVTAHRHGQLAAGR
jgi:RHH-type transcriptional regulator, proline utilization regulon repressor / proline dehydrogenase / delta 1-pyrroline-5-carboxylate dehydrogenase